MWRKSFCRKASANVNLEKNVKQIDEKTQSKPKRTSTAMMFFDWPRLKSAVEITQNYVLLFYISVLILRKYVFNSCCSSAGLMRACDGCIHVLCDDIVPVFTAGWCPGILHSSGDTNQASIVSSSVIAVFWHSAPLAQWDAGNTTSAMSK